MEIQFLVSMDATRDGRPDLTNIEMDLLDTRFVKDSEEADFGPCSESNRCLKPSCFPICIVSGFVLLIIMFPLLNYNLDRTTASSQSCLQNCSVRIVESIPQGLSLAPGMSTYDAWIELIGNASHTIQVSAQYWTLRGKDIYVHPSDVEGEKVFSALKSAAADRNVKIQVVNNVPTVGNFDTDTLKREGLLDVRVLNMSRLLGSGINHAKLIIADGHSFYLGSANMDWRALTQVREVGIYAKNCDCLTSDLSKVFGAFWLAANPAATLPIVWPTALTTKFNGSRPIQLSLLGVPHEFYFSAAPAALNPPGRANDLTTLLSVINQADRYVHIEVMTYFPLDYYSRPRVYWPEIDDALRTAGIRGVQVRLLIGYWNYTNPIMLPYLRSLQAINGSLTTGGSIEVRLFKVDSTEEQAKIPYGRVNHAKFMVTDKVAYIGTSNWSKGYFVATTGISVLIRANGSGLPDQLQDIFSRDWESNYSHPLPPE